MTYRQQRKVALLGILAILLQAMVFAWHHHALAFGESRDGQAAFNHAAFEMKDWEDWTRAIFYAGERGLKRVWGPGRHLFGNNLFSYYKDPEGNTVEDTAEVEQIINGREPRIATQRREVRVARAPTRFPHQLVFCSAG